MYEDSKHFIVVNLDCNLLKAHSATFDIHFGSTKFVLFDGKLAIAGHLVKLEVTNFIDNDDYNSHQKYWLK